MPNGYSRSPKLQKGALVEFSSRFIGPVPNVIVFQYNPETLSRKLQAWGPDSGAHAGNDNASASAAKSQSMAQPQDPSETIDLSLEFDAADAMEDPAGNPVESVTGIADRLAAVEMLLYPQEDSLASALLGSIGGALGGATGGTLGSSLTTVPRGTVPVVLFVWGAGRIVPVRITNFSIEEQAFSALLYPIRAKVTVSMKILAPTDFPDNPNFTQKLAITCYNYTKTQKQTLAAANIANSVNSILGMLPF